jgi:hypothetical protein
VCRPWLLNREPWREAGVGCIPCRSPVRRRAHAIVLRPGLVPLDDQVEQDLGTLPLAMCVRAAG